MSTADVLNLDDMRQEADAAHVLSQEERHGIAVDEYLADLRARAEARRVFDAEQRESNAGDVSFIDGGTFLFDMTEEIPARWGRDSEILWAKGEALMLCGPPGVGKTSITGQVVRALLGLQREVLGFPVTPVDHVLYLAMDRPRQIARSLARHFTPKEREQVQGRLTIWPGPPPEDLAQNPDALLDLARRAGADVVVVDSLKDAAVGLSEDAVGAGYNRARQKALTAGVDVMELHHQKKSGANGGKPDKLADVYGSTWLTSGAGSVIGLWGDAGDPVVELSHLKPVMDPIGPFTVIHDHAAGVSRVDGVVDLVSLARNGVTATQAAEAIYGGKPTQAQREKARRKLDKLVTQGALMKTTIVDDHGRDVGVWRATGKAAEPPMGDSFDGV